MKKIVNSIEMFRNVFIILCSESEAIKKKYEHLLKKLTDSKKEKVVDKKTLNEKSVFVTKVRFSEEF